MFKDFKAFLIGSFIHPSVKGTGTFWNFGGIIDGFNKLRRNISSGVLKTADESMSYICFHTTPKVDFPHRSYIFKKLEPLGSEIKNVVCSRLVHMLCLDIQHGEETTKTAEFQQQI